MLDVNLARVSRPLLRDEAYERIRRAIVNGTLPPGTLLRDADLAEQLGLSRAPVRQALTRLADERLVDSKPQSYTRVAELVPADVRDARQLIRALQEFAVREAMPRLGPAEVAEMRAANERFAAAIKAGDLDAAVAADDVLHDVPVRVYGNRALAATIDRHLPLLRRLEYARFSSALGPNSVRRHTELIDAIEAGDTARAVAIVANIWIDLDPLLED
jgi:DNA-binding GntR family transcriptional regulator